MIYTIANTSAVGMPVLVFDAEDKQIDYVLECDTETGRVFRFKTIEGKLQLSPDRREAEKETVFFPAPLRVVPK